MPFDALKWPDVVVLPLPRPSASADPGVSGSRSSIVAGCRGDVRPVGLGFWLLLFLLFALAAHAQPASWQSYQIGPTTYYSGTDANAGQYDGPRGQTQHCRSWQQGGQTKTECDR
jgi:hypothetical protein